MILSKGEHEKSVASACCHRQSGRDIAFSDFGHHLPRWFVFFNDSNEEMKESPKVAMSYQCFVYKNVQNSWKFNEIKAPFSDYQTEVSSNQPPILLSFPAFTWNL